jgi:hypothetical protein
VTVAMWTVAPLLVLHLVLWRRCREVLHFQLLLDLVILAAVGPAILTGRDLNPVRALENRSPFEGHVWSDRTDYQPTQTDLVVQFHPWWEAAREQLLQGRLPRIAPGIGGGAPLLANGQSGIWAPVMAPVWALGVERGTTVMAFWKLELAGLGGFLLLRRRFRTSWLAAVTGGLGWGGTPYLVSWLLVPLAWPTAALPWLWWLGLRAMGRRRGWWWTVGAAVVFGWLMGSGLHPETSAIASGSALLAALVAAPRRWIRVPAMALGSGLVALVLVWPMVGAVAASSRTEALLDSSANQERPSWDLQRRLLAQASVPAIHGWPGRQWSQPYPHAPGAVGVGGALLVLAGLGVWRRRYRKLALSALVVGVLGIVLMMRIPPLDWILVRIPPLDHMTLPRWGVLIPWAMVVLASLAVDWVVRGGDVPTIRRLLPLVVVGGAVWIVGDVSVVGTGLTLAAGLATAAVVGRRDAIVPLIVVLEVGALAIGVNPTADPADRQPSSDVIRFVQREVADSGGRIVGTRRSFTPNLASRYGLEDLRSWDPVRAVPFVRLMRVLGEPEAIMGGPLNDLPSGLVGAWHVRWAVTRPPVELGPGWLLRFSSPSGRVYENAHHLPPVRAVGRAIPEPENVAEIRQVVQGMDFARVALVDGAATGVAATSVRVDDVLFDPDRIEVTVRSDGPCLVVAARPWAPGWNVWVDGAPAALRRTNVAGLGAVVPQGEHRVAFIYRPWRW